MHSRLTTVLSLPIVLTLCSCIGVPQTENPIPSIETTDSATRHNSLLIMLPGRGDRAKTFIREGFQDTGGRWGFDTIAVDAHLGYYMDRSLLPRLHEDIVTPARRAGYENIWLLGVSMGGFGSLLYVTEYPDQIDGVILLAPYLGDGELVEKISADGGLAAWSGEAAGYEDYEIAIWNWLRDAANRHTAPSVILGYGESDRNARTFTVLAEALDPSQVYTLEGAHNWNTWRSLWERISAHLRF